MCLRNDNGGSSYVLEEEGNTKSGGTLSVFTFVGNEESNPVKVSHKIEYYEWKSNSIKKTLEATK